MEHDGIWRPERLVSGSWVAARYVEDLDLNRPRWREEDIVVRNGISIANYYDTLGQCEARCALLNSKA
jgi:hypothetical protein